MCDARAKFDRGRSDGHQPPAALGQTRVRRDRHAVSLGGATQSKEPVVGAARDPRQDRRTDDQCHETVHCADGRGDHALFVRRGSHPAEGEYEAYRRVARRGLQSDRVCVLQGGERGAHLVPAVRRDGRVQAAPAARRGQGVLFRVLHVRQSAVVHHGGGHGGGADGQVGGDLVDAVDDARISIRIYIYVYTYIYISLTFALCPVASSRACRYSPC